MAVVYERADNVVWRIAPDRVVLRRLGHRADGGIDLFGTAAVAWAALDSPATTATLVERIVDAGVELPDPATQIDAALGEMTTAGLVVGRTP